MYFKGGIKMLLKFYLAVYRNNCGFPTVPGEAEMYYQICIHEGKNVDLLGRIVILAIRKAHDM